MATGSPRPTGTEGTALSRNAAKSFAVSDEIYNELVAEGRPYNLNLVMGTELRYDINTIPLFLEAVKLRLAARAPSYAFTFDAAFSARALGLKVGVLNGEVDARTVEVDATESRKKPGKSKKKPGKSKKKASESSKKASKSKKKARKGT